MRSPSVLRPLVVACAVLGFGAFSAPLSAQTFAVKEAGLATPESVVHDAHADVYLVSNINGVPSEKDGNGFISRVNPDGRVDALRWIAGGRNGVTLHAPKGLAIVGDTLYVSDIDCVRRFNRTSGAPAGETCVEGATFLNDLAADGNGTLYVSDTGIRIDASGVTPTGTDAVYRLRGTDAPQIVARGADLKNPNGLWWTPGGLVVVPFGANEVWRYAPDGTRTVVATTPSGQLDGVVGLPDGGLLVTSWEGSAVYRLSSGGAVSTVATGIPSPADLGFDAKRSRALVPVFTENRIEGLPIK